MTFTCLLRATIRRLYVVSIPHVGSRHKMPSSEALFPADAVDKHGLERSKSNYISEQHPPPG
jgi:hypothetical protein